MGDDPQVAYLVPLGDYLILKRPLEPVFSEGRTIGLKESCVVVISRIHLIQGEQTLPEPFNEIERTLTEESLYSFRKAARS